MPFAIEWKPSFAGKLQQVTLAPFVYLLILPMCIAVQWLVELSERIMRRITLWKIIFRSKHEAIEPPLPETKTLWGLWQIHGIERRRFGEEHATELLDQWIVILYGKETADRLNIESRRKDMWRRNIKAKMPYYKREPALCVLYKNPFDCILEQVSEELSVYD